jgi:glycine hydroxymethyltransferase
MNRIERLAKKEFARQRDTLNLIASENYPSPKTLKQLGAVWSTKYAEGYPGKRYYAGNENTDKMESIVQELALKVFDKTGEYGVNVQLLSGSPANWMVYLTMLERDDTIMSLNLANGGHLSHLHQTSNFLKFFKHATYDVKEVVPGTFEIDIADYKKKLAAHTPKLVIIGFSAYSRSYEFEEMCRLAHDAGALVLADVAHINGLIAAGLHDSPFKKGSAGADFVSMTTHKTLRGPRGAMLFAKKDYIELINRTIFPGTSGGPHMHQIAATGQCLMEIMGEDQYPDGIDFVTYSKRILSTCKALENALGKSGLEVISPTQNHLCLIKLPKDSDSLELQIKLETLGIITNRNMLPFDTKSAWRPSGMRLGTPALASRGLTDDQAGTLGGLIADAVFARRPDADIKKAVSELASQMSWYYKS